MYRKELTYYFSSPIAYIVIGLYLVAISLFLWVIPGEWNIVDAGYADVKGLFELSPWLLMLLCPSLTMRLFAEERLTGTWNLVLIKHVPLWRLVTGKFLAAWTLTLMAIIPCVVHYFVVYFMAEPIGNVDGGQFAGSLLGLIALSGVFTALGLIISTLSKNQIVAFIGGVVLCFVLYWLNLQDYCSSISRGVVDLRDVIWFASLIIFSVALSTILIDKIHRK
ncbi:MAG: ABC transporter permease subunit [Paludibacteraceae bacterium]|nr:ABC transporter permease subunit [Paludibacteraceae bacterium]